MKMKRPLCAKLIASLSLMFLIGYGCGGGGGGGGDGGGNDGNDEPPVQSDNKFYSNPTDERVLTIADKASGATYTYNGTIKSDGQLSKLTSVVVKDPEIEGDLVYILDDNGNPKTIYTPESTFALEPISDTEVRLTAISDNGELQLSIPLEAAADSSASLDDVSTKGDSLKTRQSTTLADNRNMQLTLTKCGKAVEDALVTVSISPQIGTSNPIGTHIGNGRYAFNIPKTVDPKLDLLKKCDRVAEEIKEYCGYASFIDFERIQTCEELAAIAGAVPFIGDDLKEKVTDYCIPALIKHLPKIKAQICIGTAAEEIEKLCRWEVILAEPEKTHTFAFSITRPSGESFTTEPVAFSPNEPSEWTLEAPTEISLEKKMYFEPANPENTEWYTAYASMVCPDPENGTRVTLSVQGSDGYQAATEDVIKVNSTLSLDIPPAKNPEEEVTDTFTVTAEGKTWGIGISAAEQKIWTMVVHRNADEDYVETQKFYLFKRSGTGYRKMWGGYAEKRTGYDYFYLNIRPSEVSQALSDAKDKLDEDTENACASTSPATCPCPTYPDIWETGDVELVDSFDTAAEMDTHRCDTYQFDPSNIICTKWDVDTDPKYWDNINAICGD
jgi:hypothetical protein